LDINLPDGNGLELVKMARKYSAVNQVIIITGYSDLSRVISALELGAVDYFTKPLDMEVMKERVFEAANRYKRWYRLVKMELQAKQKK
jgi:DNA-binding response OmpR family regulator